MSHPRATQGFGIKGAALAAALLATTLLTACGEEKASDKTRAIADRELKSFVTNKFEKLQASDFALIAEEKKADGSWEFIYESRSAPELQLPRFRLFFTVDKLGSATVRAQKENVPGLPPVGADALRAQQQQQQPAKKK